MSVAPSNEDAAPSRPRQRRRRGEDEHYIRFDGNVYGPATMETIRRWDEEGRIPEGAMIGEGVEGPWRRFRGGNLSQR